MTMWVKTHTRTPAPEDPQKQHNAEIASVNTQYIIWNEGSLISFGHVIWAQVSAGLYHNIKLA